MQFAIANREVVAKQEGIELNNVIEIGKALGEAWRRLTPEDKKPYEDLAAKDMERYKREKSVMPPKLKRVRTAFIYFSNANRDAILAKLGLVPRNIRESGKALGEVWRKVKSHVPIFFSYYFLFSTPTYDDDIVHTKS